ncbi:MAG TPA: class I SAM-dependent methyltransferase [Gemmataceae bacterium]|nr:class I SAM-dependent methyltransferase [Gemmataceae bacterium]
MNAILRGLVRTVSETFTLPGPILEIGSYQVTGQEGVADLRTLFPGRTYQGVDIRPGLGVDLLANVEELPYAAGSIGTILAISTLEHVPHFWRAFDEMHRVLRPDGALLVACPFYFHRHAHPNDYWRFTPEALEMLLAPYPSKIVGYHGPPARPANVWGLAFREDRPSISAEEYNLYQTRLHHHARMPLPLTRYLRLQLGRFLFGPGHFAPYLQREHLGNKCLNQAVEPPRSHAEHGNEGVEIRKEERKERHVHIAA